MATPRIHVDFETRSAIDLKFGSSVYARHYSTAVLMLSIIERISGTETVIDFMGDRHYQACCWPHSKPGDMLFRFIKPPCPPIILRAIAEGWIFVAHNARFEQDVWYHICHMQWGWPMPLKWSCTAARARYWGLRANLEGAASDLEVPVQKNPEGKQFINDFCKPRKYKGPKRDGIIKELWYEPQENPAGWRNGLMYCLDDARAEEGVDDILPDLPAFEQAVWELDFKVNLRGLPIDLQSVERAIEFSDHFTAQSVAKFNDITNLNPTQRDKVLEYINQREEIEQLGDLRSKTLKRITLSELPHDLQDVVQIRLETSKASIKKLQTMRNCTDTDGRARGLFLYGGAHTMRWSAKRIQPQNFTRPNPDQPQDYMFDYLAGPWWEMPAQPAWIQEAGIRFMRPLGYLSTSMRGFIQAPKGKKFVVGDYAQIEVRVLAWLARCLWVLDAFRDGTDIYCKFAAEFMYNEPYEDYFEYNGNKRSVRKSHKRKRQVAKSAELGCGYGLGKDKFVEYCDNSDLIITAEESAATISAYRNGHPEIADWQNGLWARAERAAIYATANEGQTVQLGGTGITLHVHRLDSVRYWLIVTMPSGSHMTYYRPKISLAQRFGKTVERLSFRTEWNGKSYRENTYGGKLVENWVQHTARDICAQGALNAEAAGYEVIGLVHDEVISEVDIDFGTPHELEQAMCALPAWITDLPVEAEAGTMYRYGK